MVEIVTVFGHLTDWQIERRQVRRVGRRRMPHITRYVDPLADSLVALSRILLGASAGFVLHSQVTGAFAAIAAGASAPALLRQFSTSKSVQQLLSGQTILEDPGTRAVVPSPTADTADVLLGFSPRVSTAGGKQSSLREGEISE
ncbi:hypothetical protein [Kitasatospora sp. GP30]|uniref:hypothetical protein n=1 Tax=Kitasatospora sp. GP30 TaxID=3035084 RepID=UPI00117D4EFF|nr:hypothetical protein [Kitasatospora sp. GP30]